MGFTPFFVPSFLLWLWKEQLPEHGLDSSEHHLIYKKGHTGDMQHKQMLMDRSGFW